MTTWDAAAASWAASLEETGKAEATIEGYLKHVGWLADAAIAAGICDPWDMPAEFFVSWLAEHAWSVITRRKVLVSLRGFYRYGIEQGEVLRSPLAGVAAPPARKRGPARIEPAPMWREPVQQFLCFLEAGGRRPGMVEQRRWWLTRLSETFADPWSVTREDLALWLARSDWAPDTKRLGLSTARTFYAWAEHGRLIEESPAEHLAPVRVPRALPRPASDDAVEVALAAADDRVALAIQLARYAGLRRAEIVQLHARDIADDHLLVSGKGGNERKVPLHPELARILRAELRRRLAGVDVGTGWGPRVPPADGYLFPSTSGGHLTPAHLGKQIRAALPAGFTTHTLRHRFATQAYAHSRDLRAVQELLGHTKPETTARYAAVPDGALQAAVLGVR